MTQYKLSSLVFVFIFILFSRSYAQDKDAQITGIVTNAEKEPAPFSTVVLMNEDSVFMKGTLSQTDGKFLLEKIDPGKYLVTIRNVEFKTYVSQPVNVSKNEKILLDTIVLTTKLNDISAVTVTAQKAMVEVHPDKMVFNISSSVNATGNNGLELISKAPGVIVDLDKNITLQGKSGVQVFINGRPTRLSGSDLTAMLEGIQSDNVESIEIISNPSAKYEAEGTGGIINIILKKNQKNGFNGSVYGNYSKGKYERYSTGTSLNYSGSKVNLFSTFNYSDDNYQDDFVESNLRDDYLLNLESFSLYHRQGFNFSGGADYLINENHTLSLDGRVTINDSENGLYSDTYISDVNKIVPTELLKSRVADVIPSDNYNLNLHYSFIPDRNSSFSTDISYGDYKNTTNTSQPNEYYDSGEENLLRTVNTEYDAMKDIMLLSMKMDFEKTIDKITLTTGAKYSYIQTDNALDYYNIENEIPELDINRSNNFSYLEKIAALYFIFNIKPSEKIILNAGVRVENTSSIGELVSEIPTNDNVVPRNYTSLFPNVSISFDDQKDNVISVSYGRRISRPNYWDLNPFESKRSEISSWKGNPFLKPEYIDNYQLTYSYKQKLVISNTFSVTHDFFSNIFITTDEKSSIITPRNMQKVINNGLSVSYPLKVTKWWQFSSFLVYNYEMYSGDIQGTVIDLSGHIVNVRLQNNFSLPWDMKMELSYYGRSPWIWRGTINVDDFHDVGVGIKKEFLNKRLQVQITGSDILNTGSDFYYNSNYGGMIIDGVRKFDNQRVGINLTYKFGNAQAKAGKIKKSAIEDELQRIGD